MQAEPDDNDKVLCKDGFGCQKKKKGKYTKSAKARVVAEAAAAAAQAAAARNQAAVSEEKEAVPLPDLDAGPEEAQVSVDIPKDQDPPPPIIVPPKPRRQYIGMRPDSVPPRKRDADDPNTDSEAPKEPKKRAVYPGGKKRGIRKGSKLSSNKTQEDWYYACQTYEQLKATTHPKLSHVDFLTSEHSGELFTGTLSERQSFGRYMGRYKQGLLQPLRVKRNKPRKYPDMEAKLIAYIDLRNNNSGLFQHEEKLSWKQLRRKCLEWAKAAGHTEFQVSPGWMDDTLKRHNVQTKMKIPRRKVGDGDDDDVDDDDEEDYDEDEEGDDEHEEPVAAPPPRKRAATKSKRAPPPPQPEPLPQMPTTQLQQPQQQMPMQQQFQPNQVQLPHNLHMPTQQQQPQMPTQMQQAQQLFQQQPMQQQQQPLNSQELLTQHLFQQQQQQMQQQAPQQQGGFGTNFGQTQQPHLTQQQFAEFQQQQQQQLQLQQQHLNANQQQQLQLLQNLRHFGAGAGL